MNPYGTALVVGYEAFGLTYDFLVGFGPDAEPAPGFAESWERAADGKSWTFKIREGMKWSDGTPATAQDACFSFQINLDAIAAESNIVEVYIRSLRRKLDDGRRDGAIETIRGAGYRLRPEAARAD